MKEQLLRRNELLSHIINIKELKKQEKIALQTETRKLELLKESIVKVKEEID